VLDAVPDAGGNGLLDCPPDRLDLMNQQARALGSATLSRMADTVHEGLTEMRGTTAPRLLLELVCARMLLPETDGSAVATLQRLERLERRMSIAGEHAGRPSAEAPAREAPAREAPVREVPVREVPVREVPVREAPVPAAPARQAPAGEPTASAVPEPTQGTAAAAPARSAGARREFVRRSQEQQAAPATAPSAPAPAGPAADDWPETVAPGSGAGRSAQALAARAATSPAGNATPPGGRATPPAASEPDIPLPPEPTDDEDYPHPASPAATRAAAARTEAAAEAGTAPTGSAPRAAAESSPVPRGGEPMPVVSANPEPAADDGELTTTDVRRMWPELLAVVKRHKRTTEALLKNAQVHQLSNGVLTLSTSSPALARRLGDDLNKDVIREALNELLGVRWRVDAVVEGAGATAGPAVAPEQAREAVRAAEAAEARELMAERAADVSSGGDRDPEPAVDPEQAALSLLRAQLGARPVES
jgi:DNA polymerase-3 subunit gamma/tau